MIIVAGHIIVKEGKRDTFLAESLTAVQTARQLQTCQDFAVSADLLDENRVNIFEAWHSQNDLDQFRQSGPGQCIMALITDVQVKEYAVDPVAD